MPHTTFSILEAAEYLHIRAEDLERLVKQGDIPFHRQGDRVVFRRGEIDAWASQRILGMPERELKSYHKVSSAKVHDLSEEHAIVTELMTPGSMEPELHSRTRASVIVDMVDLAMQTDLVNHREDLLASVQEREQMGSTALPGRFALLHPRHHDPYLFDDSFVVLGRTVQAIPFGAPDGRTTDVFFLVCCQDDRLHLHVLARLCMLCHHTDLLLHLAEAERADDMMDWIEKAEQQVIKGL